MKYTILIYESESELGALTDGARKEAYWLRKALAHGRSLPPEVAKRRR